MPLPTDKRQRKESPMYRGLLKYFPKALAYVAHVSHVANEQHNPGQEMHWAREKSTDHGDCLVRHQTEAGTADDDGLLHSGKVAWRALAQLELELENDGSHIPGLYDGDWNYPSQDAGFWRVRGSLVTFINTGNLEGYISSKFWDIGSIAARIEAGGLVRNEWVAH